MLVSSKHLRDHVCMHEYVCASVCVRVCVSIYESLRPIREDVCVYV